MTRQTATKLITKELIDLNVPSKSLAFKAIFDNAIEAYDIMTKKELKQLISDHLDTLPNSYFY